MTPPQHTTTAQLTLVALVLGGIVVSSLAFGILLEEDPRDLIDRSGLADDERDVLNTTMNRLGSDTSQIEGAQSSGHSESEMRNGSHIRSNDRTNEFDVAAVEQAIETEVNELRVANNLSTLTHDDRLYVAAFNHSHRMQNEDFVGHVWPDGTTPQDRANHAGANCSTGENVALTWFDRPVRTESGTERYENESALATALVNQWSDSPSHYENLISPTYDRHAVAIEVSDDGAVWVTHKFCG